MLIDGGGKGVNFGRKSREQAAKDIKLWEKLIMYYSSNLIPPKISLDGLVSPCKWSIPKALLCDSFIILRSPTYAAGLSLHISLGRI